MLREWSCIRCDAFIALLAWSPKDMFFCFWVLIWAPSELQVSLVLHTVYVKNAVKCKVLWNIMLWTCRIFDLCWCRPLLSLLKRGIIVSAYTTGETEPCEIRVVGQRKRRQWVWQVGVWWAYKEVHNLSNPCALSITGEKRMGSYGLFTPTDRGVESWLWEVSF